MGFRLVPISPAQITAGPLPPGVTVPVGQVTSGRIAGLFTVGSPAGPRAEIGTNAGGESGIRLYSDATTKTVTMDAATGNATFTNVTVRGNLALSTAYAPVTSVYDGSAGGAPLWNVGGTYTLFSGTAWAAVDVQVPASGRIRWDLLIQGMNNVSASATLGVDLEALVSSTPGGTAFVGPGTTIHTPNLSDSAFVSCQVTSTAAQSKASAFFVLDGLNPGDWIRIRPYWRISSGATSNVTFPNLSSKFTVTPIV